MSKHSLSIPAGVSSCAEATSAREAEFRIDYPLAAARNTRVIGLDAPATAVVADAARLAWGQARFFSATDPGHLLNEINAGAVDLADALHESNTVVMVASTGDNGAAVSTIGAACKVRGIMTAGLVLTPSSLSSDALLHLRAHARILLVPADDDDLIELLRATRA